MKSKQNVVKHLQIVRRSIENTISMIEKGDSCIHIHEEINHAIMEIETTKRILIKNYSFEYLSKLFKTDSKSVLIKQEIYKFF